MGRTFEQRLTEYQSMGFDCSMTSVGSSASGHVCPVSESLLISARTIWGVSLVSSRSVWRLSPGAAHRQDQSLLTALLTDCLE